MQLIKTKQKLLTIFTVLSLHLASLSSIAVAQSQARLDTASPPQINNKKAQAADKPILKTSTKGSACVLNKGQQLADKLAALGQNLTSRVLLPMQKSVFEGMPIEYVSSQRGELAFAVNDISFGSSSISSPTSPSSPLLFQRYYTSGSKEDAGLGKGWRFLYDEKISIAGGRATLTNSFGEKFEYAAVNSRLEKREGASSMKFALQRPQPAIAQSFQFKGSDEIVEKTSAYKKTYGKFGAEFYLTNIQLATGGSISIERNADGRIAKVSHDDKFIQFKWSEGEQARLLSVVDNAKRRVDFVHRDGLLKSVRTVSGGKWAYSYKNGKLVKVLNPLGYVELEVQYEGERVAQTSNEASFKRYSYSDKATTVTTSENYAQTFEHDAKGLVRRIYDRQGVLAELEYDDAHRVKSISDGKKATMSFEYDQGGRLVRQQMPNGMTRVFEYDADGSKKRAKVKPFINLANQERLRSEARIGSEEESSETVYDAVGRKVAEKLSDGTIIRYRYDASGNIVRMWDAKSRELRAEYDALNSLTKMFNQHGWVRAERDRAGRIVKLENSGGQTREFVYNTDGALVKFKNAEGKEYRYFYTLRGKLRAVVNEKGRVVEYRLDEKGNAVSTKRYWLDKDTEVTFGKISYHRNAPQEQAASFRKIAYRRNVQWQDRTIFNCNDLGLNDGFNSYGPLTHGTNKGFTPVFRCGDTFGPIGRNGLNPRFNSFFFRKDDCEKKCKKERKHDCDLAYDTCKGGIPKGAIAGAGAGAGIGMGLGFILGGGPQGAGIGSGVGAIVGGIAGVVSTYYECSAEHYRCTNTLRTLRECIKRCEDKGKDNGFYNYGFY